MALYRSDTESSTRGPTRKLAYRRIDVFTDEPFGGNPLAVFPDAGDLDPRVMQRIAAEMNLSESTFVGAPSDEGKTSGCDLRVRIFTPGAELPMAGHPTVGTAFSMWTDGRLSGEHVTFEEGVGPVPVRIDTVSGGSPHISMLQPPPEFGAIFEDRRGLAKVLGIDPADLHPEWQPRPASCGVPFLMVPLASLDAVRRARPMLADWNAVLSAGGVAEVLVFSSETEHPDRDVHVRVFAPNLGIPEDPATGGAAGPLGAHLLEAGILGTEGTLDIRIEQGLELGRPSRIDVQIAGPEASEGKWRIGVGGRCVAMGEGVLEVPE